MALCYLYSKYFSFFVTFYLANFFYRNECFISLCLITPILTIFAYWLLPRRKLKGIGGDRCKVVVIGCGFSGINVGVRLGELGVDYVILEKSSGLGGTWHDNVYPGAACDVPSHLYSYSFYPYPWWSRNFGQQSEIRQYLEDAASHFRVYPHIRFNREVTAAEWDEATQKWTVTTSDGGSFVGNFVVSCCGELHVPNVPEFKGKKDFTGEIFHSSRWNPEVDLTGKRIAVVGTGASAVQIVPAIAEKAHELYVMQRTPIWCPPVKVYGHSILLQLLLAIFPPALTFHRWYLYWYTEFKFSPLLDRTKKEALKTVMQSLSAHTKAVVKDPKIADLLTPTYDFGCKRSSPSVNYLQTFNRDNVHLVTDKIEKLTGKGLKTSGGEEIPLDIIVLCTGFDLDKSYKAFQTKGRHGKIMQEEWGDQPNAYKGSTFPNMPNMFLVLGPNTSVMHNSRIFMIECQVNYAVDCIRKLVSSGRHTSMEVKTKVYQDYQHKLAKKMKNRIFAASTCCDSYYKNSRGVNFSLWYGDLTNFWSITRRSNMQDYNLK